MGRIIVVPEHDTKHHKCLVHTTLLRLRAPVKGQEGGSAKEREAVSLAYNTPLCYPRNAVCLFMPHLLKIKKEEERAGG